MDAVIRQTTNPPSQNGDTHADYMSSLNRPSLHVTSAVNNIVALNGNNNVNFTATFPVREIIIRANYAILTTLTDSYYATCNCPAFAQGSGLIMGFNGSVAYNSVANNFVFCGSFNQSVMRYILRQPMMLQGTWQWQLRAVDGQIPNADVLLDFELLG